MTPWEMCDKWLLLKTISCVRATKQNLLNHMFLIRLRSKRISNHTQLDKKFNYAPKMMSRLNRCITRWHVTNMCVRRIACHGIIVILFFFDTLDLMPLSQQYHILNTKWQYYFNWITRINSHTGNSVNNSTHESKIRIPILLPPTVGVEQLFKKRCTVVIIAS